MVIEIEKKDRHEGMQRNFLANYGGYKYPQPNTCDKCKLSDEKNECTVFTKREDKIKIWLANRCDRFESEEVKMNPR